MNTQELSDTARLLVADNKGPLSFSFARALQQPALEIWRGEDINTVPAQHALAHRARCNRAARRGEYSAAMETTSR